MIASITATAVVAARLAGCLLTADFLSGLLHWYEDTWLVPGRNAFLDHWIVEPNIDHHRRPGGIRECSYWVLNCVCIAIAGVAMLVLGLAGVRAWEPYLILAIASQSNQLHAWAHTSRPPAIVAFLQRIHLLQSAKEHAVHHRRPYAGRYCTTTNLLNPLLDAANVWRMLEWIGERLGAVVARATPLRGGY